MVRTEDRYAVVHIAGDVDMSSSAQLRARLIDLIDAGQHHLILDLDHVDFLDSTGLAVLVATAHRLRARGGSLCLVSSRDAVLLPLRITGLAPAFTIHAALADALGLPCQPDA